jgi:uncharacterized protein YbjT (DUF2867 family)
MMIVVTGATGNVGRPLVRALVEAGEQVTAVARGISASDVPAGVPHQRADLVEPGSLKPALEGADALFLLTSGDWLSAGGNPAVVADILDIARACGVRRVVLLSSQGVASGRHPSGLEDAVKESGLDWTMLRPGGFDSNAFAWAELVRTQRMVAAPFGDVGLPTVDPLDIAEVAAVVLRESEHGGAAYTLTGLAPISPRQQATAIGDALGEPVGFIEQSRAEARALMLRFMPEQVADTSLDILGAPSAFERRASPDVERIIGRPARSFAEWAARNVAAFS